jgi:ubiquinol oxidase
VAAPVIAKHYWKLAADAMLRDVVFVVRADDSHHRDINHRLASRLVGRSADGGRVTPYPQHAPAVRPDA